MCGECPHFKYVYGYFSAFFNISKFQGKKKKIWSKSLFYSFLKIFAPLPPLRCAHMVNLSSTIQDAHKARHFCFFICQQRCGNLKKSKVNLILPVFRSYLVHVNLLVRKVQLLSLLFDLFHPPRHWPPGSRRFKLHMYHAYTKKCITAHLSAHVQTLWSLSFGIFSKAIRI